MPTAWLSKLRLLTTTPSPMPKPNCLLMRP